jgi:alpha-L-fucosidase
MKGPAEFPAPGRSSTHVLISMFCLLAASVSPLVVAQNETGRPPANLVVIHPGESIEDIVRNAANVVPSTRQFIWQEQEFVGFLHFGMNTFTDREWGTGTEDPALFNPTDLDARQWVKAMKDAGIKRTIITAKHHDGFCLWPSTYTGHSVRNSPWRGGKGDVVGEVAAACKEYGLDFGVYLSPWDRHEPCYGDSPKYNEHFRNQLRELLTNYGIVAEVWFDGACGEGPNGKRQVYDWQSYYALIRELQPGAVIAIMGPDVRWVGTESGYGRDTEWSVVPDIAQNLDAIAAGSQQNPVDGAFIPHDLTSDDLGSREKLKEAKSLVWYPAETDVSIRPGWFYHADQDAQVKSPEKLVDIYYSSVGRNSVLLLNIPPDKRGRIHDNDVRSLLTMRKILNQTFSTNLLAGATVTASSEENDRKAEYAIDSDNGTYWSPAGGVTSATLECTFAGNRVFDRAMLQECIRAGQRVESFHLDAWDGHSWKQIVSATTIGYKRLLRFPPVTASRVRLVIDASRTSPTISTFSLHKAPPAVTGDPAPGGGS